MRTSSRGYLWVSVDLRRRGTVARFIERRVASDALADMPGVTGVNDRGLQRDAVFHHYAPRRARSKFLEGYVTRIGETYTIPSDLGRPEETRPTGLVLRQP